MNRMTRNRTLIATCLAGVLGASAFAASAQSAQTVSADAQAQVSAQADADAQARADETPTSNAQARKPDDSLCLRETGSRVRQIDPKTGKPACRGPGRAYNRDELDRTGRTNLADALRAVDPSVR